MSSYTSRRYKRAYVRSRRGGYKKRYVKRRSAYNNFNNFSNKRSKGALSRPYKRRYTYIGKGDEIRNHMIVMPSQILLPPALGQWSLLNRVSNNPTTHLLGDVMDIQRGTGRWQRLGQRICIKEMSWRGHLSFSPRGPMTDTAANVAELTRHPVRIIVYCVRNGTLPFDPVELQQVADVGTLTSGMTFSNPYRPGSMSGYRILHDSIIRSPPPAIAAWGSTVDQAQLYRGGCFVPLEVTVRPNQVVTFLPGTTTGSYNERDYSIEMLAIVCVNGDGATYDNSVTFEGVCRTLFTA